MMLAPITPVFSLTTIRRTKLLPVDGRVLVRSGQKVTPLDVVAEANLPTKHLILNVARGMGLSPQEADKVLTCKQGDKVSEGDILAGPAGMIRRVIRAPANGRVIFAGDGQVMLELEQPPYELRAGMPGIVTSLIPDRGVELQTTGVLIQGVWGNGQLDAGLMKIINNDKSKPLMSDHLTINFKGAIAVGGYCNEVEVLRTAAELPVRGLILGSMTSLLESEAMGMPFPIILVDGFGELPLNKAAYEMLVANDQKEVVINAERYDRWEFKCPEIIIPSTSREPPPEPVWAAELSANQQVKIVQGPYRTEIGTLVNLRPKLEVFPSGLRAPAAVVRLNKVLTVVVPLVNLEIIG